MKKLNFRLCFVISAIFFALAAISCSQNLNDSRIVFVIDGPSSSSRAGDAENKCRYTLTIDDAITGVELYSHTSLLAGNTFSESVAIEVGRHINVRLELNSTGDSPFAWTQVYASDEPVKIVPGTNYITLHYIADGEDITVPTDRIPLSITANYTGGNVRVGELPPLNESNFTIQETYEDGTETGNPLYYSLTIPENAKGKVGNIPLTITRKGSEISSTVTVPYRYASSAPTVNISAPSQTVAQIVGSTNLSVTAQTASYPIYGSEETSAHDSLSYQWLKDSSEVSGATDASYSPQVSEAGESSYSCRITYTPSSEYAESQAAQNIVTDTVKIKVAPWTLTVTDSKNTVQAPSDNGTGEYALEAGKSYAFTLDNEDTSNAVQTAKSQIQFSSADTSYLSIDGSTVSVNTTFTTEQTATLTASIPGYTATLFSVPLKLLPAAGSASGVYTDWSTLKTDITAYTDKNIEKQFTLSGTLEATEYLTVKGKIMLVADSNGATIYRGTSFNGNFFSLEDGATLTLGGNGNQLTLDGHSSSDEEIKANSPILSVSDSTLEINNNVTIQNNYTSQYQGGAIYLKDSTLRMYDGSIRNNKNTSSNYGGGAIYCLAEYTDCTIEMLGGSISENSASQNGGGIYAQGTTDKATAKITMSGTAVIENNSTSINKPTNMTGNGGGGVYLKNAATSLTVANSAKIQNNSASKASGGGIFNTNEGCVTIWDTDAVTGNISASGYGNNIYNHYKIGENEEEVTLALE